MACSPQSAWPRRQPAANGTPQNLVRRAINTACKLRQHANTFSIAFDFARKLKSEMNIAQQHYDPAEKFLLKMNVQVTISVTQ
jgi:hypothetical protein